MAAVEPELNTAAAVLLRRALAVIGEPGRLEARLVGAALGVEVPIMRILLWILAIVALLVGAIIFAAAKSAIHEIEGFMLFLISAVFISGAGVVEAVNRLRKDMVPIKEQAGK